jgi:hypothetical protein
MSVVSIEHSKESRRLSVRGLLGLWSSGFKLPLNLHAIGLLG